MIDSAKTAVRRRLLKVMPIGAGVVWSKPIVYAVFLPAQAQTSPGIELAGGSLRLQGAQYSLTDGMAILPTLSRGQAVNLQLPAGMSGTPPYTYSLTPETLPAGLSFTPTSRRISGTLSATYTKTDYIWRVTDYTGRSATLSFPLAVMEASSTAAPMATLMPTTTPTPATTAMPTTTPTPATTAMPTTTPTPATTAMPTTTAPPVNRVRWTDRFSGGKPVNSYNISSGLKQGERTSILFNNSGSVPIQSGFQLFFQVPADVSDPQVYLVRSSGIGPDNADDIDFQGKSLRRVYFTPISATGMMVFGIRDGDGTAITDVGDLGDDDFYTLTFTGAAAAEKVRWEPGEIALQDDLPRNEAQTHTFSDPVIAIVRKDMLTTEQTKISIVSQPATTMHLEPVLDTDYTRTENGNLIIFSFSQYRFTPTVDGTIVFGTYDTSSGTTLLGDSPAGTNDRFSFSFSVVPSFVEWSRDNYMISGGFTVGNPTTHTFNPPITCTVRVHTTLNMVIGVTWTSSFFASDIVAQVSTPMLPTPINDEVPVVTLTIASVTFTPRGPSGSFQLHVIGMYENGEFTIFNDDSGISHRILVEFNLPPSP